MADEASAREDAPGSQKRELVKEILRKRAQQRPQVVKPGKRVIDENANKFAADPAVLALRAQHETLARLDLKNPYFLLNEAVARGTTTIGGRELINFANYNYLGLSGESSVSQAAKDAIDLYGTSVSASRIASGERPVQGELERALAEMMDVEDCIVYVSGHATNVTTIGHLFGHSDVIFHDELAHNSAIQGALLSGAKRIPFPHNDWRALDRLMSDFRTDHNKALIFVEGVYSMDGDIPELPRFVELRNRHRAFLMIDEAHSIGVLGERGLGIREHFGLKGSDADLWMGTLSKTFASCGGYVAAGKDVVEYLKYSAPGFLYSVGISPPNAAAALAALEVMRREPERVATVRARAKLFLDLARERKLDTGLSAGTAVVPIIIGDSMRSIALANALLDRGVNVQPVLYPAVAEKASRLRFFITSAHSEEQIRYSVDAIASELARLTGRG
jgi:8-amino-7-oxononanoate synthase